MKYPEYRKTVNNLRFGSDNGCDFNMPDNQLLSHNIILKVIALIALLSGVLGLIFWISLVLFTFFKTGDVKFSDLSITAQVEFLLMVLLGFILYTISFFSGYLLYKRRLRGLILSIIDQIFHIMQFKIGSIYYFYVSGFSAGVIMQNGQLKFNQNMGIRLLFSFKPVDEPGFISINLIAIIIIIYLLMILNKIRRKNVT
jgi:hypothetical protein